MSIIDRLKNIKDQLPKNKLEEKVQKENTIKDNIIAEVKTDSEEEPTVHPELGPAKEDYIMLNTFQIQFPKGDWFIKEGQIFAVKKADRDIINSYEDNELKISFTMVDAKHYFGKPSEYTNFKSDQDIYDLIEQFNQNPPEWMDFVEYGDDSELCRLTTRYWGLSITRVEFPEFNTLTTELMKYYTVTLCYEKKKTYYGQYEEIVE